MIRLGPSVLQGISSVIAISSAYPLTREIRSSTIFIQQYAVSRFHLVALAIASSTVMITVQIVWIEPVKLRCLTLLIVSGRCLSASFRRTENQRALHPAVLLRQALPVGEEAEAVVVADWQKRKLQLPLQLKEPMLKRHQMVMGLVLVDLATE